MTLIQYLLLFIGFFGFFLETTAEAADPFAPDATDFRQWGPSCPMNTDMPTADEIGFVRAWEEAAFAGQPDKCRVFAYRPRVQAELLYQDHNLLRFNESCMGTPLNPGGKPFEHGIGTHANSAVRFHTPEPVEAFEAVIGVDINFNNSGNAGSVVFVVEADGTELFRSPILRGSDGPRQIRVDIDPPASDIVLKTEDGDGCSCDHADWCEPVCYTSGGGQIPLWQGHTPLLKAGRYPFSFTYDDRSSDDLLPNWEFSSSVIDPLRTVYTWRDPKTGLVVDAEVRRFERFAALEWLLRFRNEGTENTPLLTDVHPLRIDMALGLYQTPIDIETLRGDHCDESSWFPESYQLGVGEEKTFAPEGGRSSNLAMPFWNITRSSVGDHDLTEGVFVTLGWSGQWEASFCRSAQHETRAAAGQQTLATILYPNEAIRTPRVLVMPWYGENILSFVKFRRLLMHEYAPRWEPAGQAKTTLPQQQEFFGQCFDRYYRKRPGWEKFDSQVEFARRLAEAGCTSYWFDAAWFPVGFPNGVGSWRSDTENFPQGLEALGQSVHNLGLKFLLWFEPERVAPGSDIAKEHPEFTLGDPNGSRLYNLADPDAEQYLTDLLLTRIKQFGVNIYRNDFNIDPLPFWIERDKTLGPNRNGITEIRYIEAHYRMWDTFRRTIPGLWIDNCASGGRRIDLETISRSIPLWRSDTCCWPGHPEWDQVQLLSLARFIPLFGSVAWDSSAYTFRSAANPGAILQYNFLDDDYDPETAKKSIREAKVYQKFWYGDFYPLTKPVLGKTSIVAWQLDRPDLGAGVIYLFRQRESPYTGIELVLNAIDTNAHYRIRVKDDYEPGEEKTVSGGELKSLPITLSRRGSAIVIEYQKVQ
ncbi:MAG: NPCBM/NEW2 domain-containing protein [Thermoguttaceae bacterium]|nr:NPCBM/NEW2 domain-containing protein [Thermoguttaceae bacterium]